MAIAHAISAELHHHGGIGGGGDATGREGDHGKTAQSVNIVQDRAHAGVHFVVNCAEGRDEVGAGEFGVGGKNTVAFHDLLSGEVQTVIVQGLDLLDFLVDEPGVSDGCHHVSGTCLTLGSNHGGTFPDAPRGFTKPCGAANKGNFVFVFVDVEVRVCRRQDLAFVNHVNAHGFEDPRFAVVSDS